ncbi:DEAD/DEAH box helicase family protein [Nocardia sp. NPDC059246]|uniref:DEAD/DEAH box helicase n=1 Tax=unclassified Nocardia TaxID=2637762 RepID=UPI00368BFA71
MVAEITVRHAAENTARAALTRRIAVALLGTPCQSAQQLSVSLGLTNVTPTVVTQLLYSEPNVFEILGPEQPAIWAVREAAAELVTQWAQPETPRSVTPQPDSEQATPAAPRTGYAGPPLRAWQSEALAEWARRDRRGIVEAVTGSGKTAVGIHAAATALDERRQAVVLVPGIDLQTQWLERLRSALPGHRIDRVGGKGPARPPAQWDVLVATVQTVSSTPLKVPPGALLVADEVHRYGAGSYAKALTEHYEWRLGLTATLERNDNAVEQILLPYFGGLVPGCDYARARADGILAPVRLALAGVHFTPRERAKYDRADEAARKAKSVLIDGYGAPEDSFGEFMAFAQRLAEQKTGEAARQARRFLKYFAERREVLADCQGKLDLVSALPIAELRATQSIFFAERTSTAGHIQSTLQQLDLSCGFVGSGLQPTERERIIADFRRGELRALAAPRVLDEGIDIPDAQLGMVLAASRSRRQMIQRMGRVVRPKSTGSAALFVVAYVYGTPEDPALGAHEAFLSDLESVAEERVTTDAAGLPSILRSWLSDPSAQQAAATDSRHSFESATATTAPQPSTESGTAPGEPHQIPHPTPADFRTPVREVPRSPQHPTSAPSEQAPTPPAADVYTGVPTPLEAMAQMPTRRYLSSDRQAPQSPAAQIPKSPPTDPRAPAFMPPLHRTETGATTGVPGTSEVEALAAGTSAASSSAAADAAGAAAAAFETRTNAKTAPAAEFESQSGAEISDAASADRAAEPTARRSAVSPPTTGDTPARHQADAENDAADSVPVVSDSHAYRGSGPSTQPTAPAGPVPSGPTYRERVAELLGAPDVSGYWKDAGHSFSKADFDSFVEWQADTLYYLSRPWDGDTATWRRTMRAIINWAASPDDPIDTFLEVSRAVSEVGPNRTELLRFAATMRGRELADLL